MSQYEISPGQQRYLRKKYAQERELEVCCDCPGCGECNGFVRNCLCDILTMEQVKRIRDTATEPVQE